MSLTEGTLCIVESKSEEGERLLALPPTLVDVLTHRYQQTPYKANSDYVFAHPQTGAPLGADRYREQLRKALEAADISDRGRIQPFRDARRGADAPRAYSEGERSGTDDDRRTPLVRYNEAIPAPRRPHVPGRSRRARRSASLKAVTTGVGQ